MSFQRENRYMVLKRADIFNALLAPEAKKVWDTIQRLHDTARKNRGKEPLTCLVIESDWPEYEPAWDEIQRRMEDRPTIMDEELGRWQDEIYKLCCDHAPDAQIDGGGCDSGDPLDLTTTEIAQAFGYWDNLLFDTLESVSHAKVEGSTFKAAAEMITTLAAENEKLSQQVCDECSPDNYGWVENRVEGRGACTCMIEAEPFQILLEALEKLACLGNGDQPGNSTGNSIAIEALRSVLPLDYRAGWSLESKV